MWHDSQCGMIIDVHISQGGKKIKSVQYFNDQSSHGLQTSKSEKKIRKEIFLVMQDCPTPLDAPTSILQSLLYLCKYFLR
jgi:hypothetical protein